MKSGDLITDKSKPFDSDKICGWRKRTPYYISFYESGYIDLTSRRQREEHRAEIRKMFPDILDDDGNITEK